MKIVRFEDASGVLRLGEVQGDGTARPLAGDLFGGLRGEASAAVSVARRLAPLRPTAIFCIGRNYGAHAAETGAAEPEHPVVFMKNPAAVTDPDSPIVLPRCCADRPQVDWEAELAVVIGRDAKDVPEDRALEVVLGYTAANDVSARVWQKQLGGGQFVRGKSFDTFCPLGPVLVTADELGDPQDLGVRCRVNGECVQDGRTGEMIFPVARLIAFLSQDTTLKAGTVILTGTPAGVGAAMKPPRFLAAGDRVEVEIEGIGTLSNPVAAA